MQDNQLVDNKLINLIKLKDGAYNLDTPSELGVYVCNEMHKLDGYFQAITWHRNKLNRIEIIAASGVSRVDSQSIITQFIVTLVKRCLKSKRAIQAVNLNMHDLSDDEVKKAWQEHFPPYCQWLPFVKDDEIDAGMIIFYDKEISEQENPLKISLINTISHVWYNFPQNKRKQKGFIHNLLKSSRNKFLVALGVFFLLLIPVRESSLAPASVVPTKPIVVSSSITGVIQDIHVQPNAFVKKGDLLVTLDNDTLLSDLDIAKKELSAAKAEYLVASQRAFDEDDAKAQVNLLKSRSDTAALGVERAESLLQRAAIYAEQDGLAIFTDKYEFLGQQVRVGERILLLADVDAVEIDVYMPVGDTIDFQVGDEVLLFLNTDPSKPIKANLRQTSYEPRTRDNGDFVFQMKAQFDSSEYKGRIGWAGTAKVYSSKKVSLFMYLFRRPISTVRRFFGI